MLSVTLPAGTWTAEISSEASALRVTVGSREMQVPSGFRVPKEQKVAVRVTADEKGTAASITLRRIRP